MIEYATVVYMIGSNILVSKGCLRRDSESGALTVEVEKRKDDCNVDGGASSEFCTTLNLVGLSSWCMIPANNFR